MVDEMQDDTTIIQGVGDEVILFISFLCVALTLMCIFLLKRNNRNQQRQQPNPRPNQQSREPRVPRLEPETLNQDTLSQLTLLNNGVEDEAEEPITAENSSMTITIVTQQENFTITVPEDTTLNNIQRSYFNRQTSQGNVIRFIYFGQILHNTHLSLKTLGIINHTSLHVHFTQQSEDRPVEPPPLDMSLLFAPLICLILALCWLSLFLWPYSFTLSSKLMIFLLSVSCAYLIYRTYA